MNNAQPVPSSAAAPTHGAASPSLELLEARQLRDAIKILLSNEQAAMAEFLVALAEFDRRRGWEPLGHPHLFAFLVTDLQLSKSAAYYRRSAAELLQRIPEVIEPLREGQLCLSTIGELAKVLTAENRSVVMPRFFGLSSREAQELVAELLPRPVPSTRMVVTRGLDRAVTSGLPAPVFSVAAAAAPRSRTLPPTSPADPLPSEPSAAASASDSDSTPAPTPSEDPNVAPLWRFPTSGIAFGGGEDHQGGALLPKRDEIVPLTATVRRVHFNVDKQVVRKLEAAREGLSHSIRGATMEQVLEAALDLLLEKQARARGQVKRPRAVLATATATQSATQSATEPPPHRRDGPRAAIPAAVRRAVWARDGDHCTWPLDGGGCCGSTHRLELDHIIPWAEWGPSTVENLRVVCARHNALAARQVFGARRMERYRHGSAESRR